MYWTDTQSCNLVEYAYTSGFIQSNSSQSIKNSTYLPLTYLHTVIYWDQMEYVATCIYLSYGTSFSVKWFHLQCDTYSYVSCFPTHADIYRLPLHRKHRSKKWLYSEISRCYSTLLAFDFLMCIIICYATIMSFNSKDKLNVLYRMIITPIHEWKSHYWYDSHTTIVCVAKVYNTGYIPVIIMNNLATGYTLIEHVTLAWPCRLVCQNPIKTITNSESFIAAVSIMFLQQLSNQTKLLHASTTNQLANGIWYA